MSDNTIHAYTIDLEATPEEIRYCKRLLSPQEAAHARSFASPSQRNQWVLGRGILSMLLAKHYGNKSPLLQRHRDNHKESAQLPISSDTGEFYSMSFADQFAFLTITHDMRVGADIERVRPIADFGGILQTLFSPREQAEFMRLSCDLRHAAFYHSWTCKEAMLKAFGNDTNISGDDFDVAVDPQEHAHVKEIRHAEEQAQNWTLLTLAPQPEYVATIACETQTKLSLQYDVVTADMLIELAEEEMTLR